MPALPHRTANPSAVVATVADMAAMKTHHILTLSALTLAAVFLAGCSGRSDHKFQGYIEGEYVYVSSPLGGALTNLAVARGDEVKSGQGLFTLERESEASAVRQAMDRFAGTDSVPLSAPSELLPPLG